MRKYLNLKLLLTCVWMFWSALALAGIEPTQNRITGADFKVNGVLNLKDEKFQNPLFDWSQINNRSVKNAVSLRVLDNVLIGYQFNYTARVRISRYTTSATVAADSVDVDLTINYDKNAGTRYRGIATYTFSGAYQIKARILSLTTNSGSAPANNMVELTGNIVIDRSYTFQPTAALLPNYITTDTAEVSMSWAHKLGAEQYDIEWTTINSGNPYYKLINDKYTNSLNPSATVLKAALAQSFRNNASRITTEDNKYVISIPSTDKYLLVRMRQVQYSADSLRLTGDWDYNNGSQTTWAIFELKWHVSNLNWQYSAAFAEEGKKKEVINYFDGGLRGRQTVTLANTDTVAIVQENIYDEFGRVTASILPAPYKSQARAHLDYQKDFNLFSTNTVYGAAQITIPGTLCEFNPSPLLNSSGAARYYSANNQFLSKSYNNYIPSAEGYPLSVTQYTNDNTGRIKLQGGVGAAFQPGKAITPEPSRTTKYFYSVPDQWELDQLFGNDVGFANRYLKNMVIDPNGQISISYLNASGKTIATALAGKPPAGLDSISTYAPLTANTKAVTSQVLAPDQFVYNSTDLKLTASTTYINTLPDNKGTFRFNLQKLINNYPGGNFQICSNCYYEMTVRIANDCGDLVASKTNPVQIGSRLSDCNDNGVFLDSLVNFTMATPGSYYITVELAFNKEVIDDYTDNFVSQSLKTGYIEQRFQYIKRKYLDSLKLSGLFSDCHTCTTLLGGKGDFVQMLKTKFISLQVDQAAVTGSVFNDWANSLYDNLKDSCNAKQATCSYKPCDDVQRLMEADVSPGGQYAQFNAAGMPMDSTINVLYKLNANVRQWRLAFPVKAATDPAYLADTLTMADGRVSSPHDATFTLDDLIRYWKPEWAVKFLPYHPEYCQLLFCVTNSNSQIWDLKVKAVEKAANVNLIPASPVLAFKSDNAADWLFVADPFFKPGSLGYGLRFEMQADLLQYSKRVVKITDTAATVKNLMKFVDYQLYCAEPGGYTNTYAAGGWNNCEPNPACRIADREWQTYRDLYFQLKEKYFGYLRDSVCSSSCAVGQVTAVKSVSNGLNVSDFVIRQSPGGPACGADSTRLMVSYSRGTVVQAVSIQLDYPTSLNSTSLPHLITIPQGANSVSFCVPQHIQPEHIAIRWVSTTGGQNAVPKVFIQDEVLLSSTSYCGGLNHPYTTRKVQAFLTGDLGATAYAANDIIIKLRMKVTNGGIVSYPERYLNIPSSSNASQIIEYVGSETKAGGVDGTTCMEDSEFFECIEEITSWAEPIPSQICPGYQPTLPGSPPSSCLPALSNAIARFPRVDRANHLNPSTPAQQAALTAEAEAQIKQQAKDICEGNADKWLEQLADGLISATQVQKDQLKSRLIAVCAAAGDVDHPFGASDKPGLTPFDSFSAVIKDFIGGATPKFTADLNPWIIDAPAPYNVKQQNTYPFIGNSNATLCNLLQRLNQQAAANFSTLYDYLLQRFKDAMIMTREDLEALQNSCDNCRFILPKDITLPVFLDPGSKGLIHSAEFVTAKTAMDAQFAVTLDSTNAKYPTILANFMNQRFGFSLTYDDYNEYSKQIATDTTVVLINKPPYTTQDADGYAGVRTALETAVNNGLADYAVYLEEHRQKFRQSYTDVCKLAQPKATISTKQQLYHYTLYYYDQADNLVRTVPPEGVRLLTEAQVAQVTATRKSAGNFSNCSYTGNPSLSKPLALQTLGTTLQSTGAVAIEAWFYSTGSQVNHLTQVSSDKKWLYEFIINDNKVGIDIYPLTESGTPAAVTFNAGSRHYQYAISQSLLPLTSWVHTVVQGASGVSGTTAPQVYLNGTPLTLNATNTAITASGFKIEATASGITYPDDMPTLKHWRFYNRTLGISEIQANAQSGCLMPQSTNALSWYRFNVPAPGAPTTVGPNSTVETTLQEVYPEHTLKTSYAYNSTNQVLQQESPDGGKNRFWYDMLSRLQVSQNDKQQPLNDYSYTTYDALGRIVQVGEKRQNSVSLGDPNYLSTQTLNTFAAVGSNSQITKTVYDEEATAGQNVLTGLKLSNLRKRVSASLTFDTQYGNVTSGVYYDYDISGNVKTLYRQLPGLGTKRVDYEYDLVSGKVNFVRYQHNQPDRFYYSYKYDAENRLTKAWSGTEALSTVTGSELMPYNKRLDASYQYYLHGPLARMELGDLYGKVQGVDYAYTLQGWLKGVNSGLVRSDKDMGKDSATIGRDVYSYQLNYYSIRAKLEADYQPVAGVQPFHLDMPRIEEIKPLFNGNISAMMVNLPKLSNGSWNYYIYKYDQLNRLIGKNVYYANNPADWQYTFTNKFKEQFTYDGNGNIRYATRYGDNNGLIMDVLTYGYNVDGNGTLINNRLKRVADSGNTGFTGDIKDQVWNNYEYDAIGNLVNDKQASIDTIHWNVYGKIKRIKKPSSYINYTYDPSGSRDSKTNGTLTTYYVRDAQGNPLAVYEKTGSTITWKEQQLYGSSRLGMFLPDARLGIDSASRSWDTLGRKRYELSNHLGNVLATISDRRLQVANGSAIKAFDADVMSEQDYYAFGGLMDGRQLNAEKYRYGFNGKENDNDVNGTGNQQDYGMRIYDPRIGKFLSVDPLTQNFPWYSPYHFAGNSPIQAIDLDGEEPIYFMHRAAMGEYGKTTQKIVKGTAVGISESLTNTWDFFTRDAWQKNTWKQIGLFFEETMLASSPVTNKIFNTPRLDMAVKNFEDDVLNGDLYSRSKFGGKFVTDVATGYLGSKGLGSIKAFATRIVKTPWDIARQSLSLRAIAAAGRVKSGAKVYRIGTFGKSATGANAQYWALENPLANPEAYAAKYNVPIDNVKNADFIEIANVKSDAKFVTREAGTAPGSANQGKGIEVVVEKGGTTNNQIISLKDN